MLLVSAQLGLIEPHPMFSDHDGDFSSACTTPPLPDFTPCSNGSCILGVCVDLCRNVSCPAPDQCHSAGGCLNGQCLVNPVKPDLTPCNSGTGLTTGDVCLQGVCVGTGASLPNASYAWSFDEGWIIVWHIPHNIVFHHPIRHWGPDPRQCRHRPCWHHHQCG